MKNILEIFQEHFKAIATTNGCVTENDYHAACAGIDLETALAVGEWLASSGLPLKTAVGEQYKQEVLEKIKNPNVNNVKDTKHHTDKNRNKKQRSKIKYPQAQLWDVSFQALQRELIDHIERYLFSSPHHDAYLAAVQAATTASELNPIWDAVVAELPPPGAAPTPPAPKPDRFREYVDLGEEEVTSAHLKDPVEAHVRQAAGNKYQAKIKKKIEFDNGSVFTVDIAETLEQKAAGLEVFDALEEDHGLLFPFDPPESVTFHMGKVRFPIDIVFLLDDEFGKNLIVSKVIPDIQPGSLDRWGHDKVHYVLEVPAGICKKLGIDVNSTCRVGGEVS